MTRHHCLVFLLGVIYAEKGVIKLNLAENSPVGGEITNLRKVIDQSVPLNADLEFRIVKQDRQNGLELFEIDKNNGILKIKQTPDREILCPRKEKCVMGLQILVLPPKYYQELTLEVTIIDENDNRPTFQDKQIFLEFMENTRSSISLDQVMAYDPDLGENGRIIYSISDNAYFTLEQSKDQIGEHLALVPKKALDREKVKTVKLQLKAANPNKSEFLTMIPIVIKVLDQNEHSPTFSKKVYEFGVDETVDVGTIIGKVGVTDGDGADSIHVSIRDQDAQKYFRVNQNGEISTSQKLDFEKTSKFDFWLVATDSAHSASARVVINLRDVNDNAPNLFITFTNGHDSIPNAGWVEEEGPIGTHVAYVRAEDSDSLKNGQTNIKLLEDNNAFHLADGILTTKIKLDREEKAEYQIVIEACDNGRKQKCTVRRGVVFVRDLNDNYPICAEETFHASISEAAEVGAYVTEIKVSDKDSIEQDGFGSLLYSLEPSSAFSIDDSGVIKLLEPLDYETKPEWELVALVQDGGGLQTRCHLLLNIEDANEAAPVFQQPTDDDLELLINSEDPEDTYLMTVIAIDPDFNPKTSNGLMKYSLAGGEEIIRLDASSGEVYLNTSANTVSDEDKTFRVVITATDSGTPAMSSNIKLTVAIREGVVSGLVQDRRAIKGGATLALIAILAALTALLILILIAVVFICRHKKLPNRYTCGNVTTGTSGPNGSTKQNVDGVKIHDDVSILYDSVLTPRSSIVPSAMNRVDVSSRVFQSNPVDKVCQKHQRRDQILDNQCRSSAASDSDHADSGKGESDQDTIGQGTGMGPRCNRQCLTFGHSDACWIEDDSGSSRSSEPLNISSISLPYDNRTNIVHSHNPSLHQNPDVKRDVHSSGYISQEDGSGRMRVLIQSTPIKSPPGKANSSSSGDHGSISNSSLVVSSRPKNGCVIDVRGSDLDSSDLTVRDLTLTRGYVVSPRVNIV